MPENDSRFSRRGFLEATGFALFVSALEGCGRAPDQYGMAPALGVEGAFPGNTMDFATVCGGCSAGCGCLVKSRDGRPIKLEGNPGHPLSQGGLCATGQASLLSLYDSHRIKSPTSDGKATEWAVVDKAIIAEFDAIRQRDGVVRVLTATTIGLTRAAKIAEFLGQFKNGRHVTYDPLSTSAILDAHQTTHGQRVLPRFRFDRADVIVSFDADFLGTWVSPVQFAAEYQMKRVPLGDPPAMSYHLQLESRMSVTGANADQRIQILPSQIGVVLSHLAKLLADKAGEDVPQESLPKSPIDQGTLQELANRLWNARGKALIVCGSQDLSTQQVCNLVNELLGAYGQTIDMNAPSRQKQGDDSQLTELLDEIRQGRVDALLIEGVNPVYDLPDGAALAPLLKKLRLTVSFSQQDDETAGACKYVCPEGHWLEQWHDAEPVDGVVSVAQPVIRPMGNTRSLPSSLAVWMGQKVDDYKAVRNYWKKVVHPRSEKMGPFQGFWDRTVHDGFANIKPTQEGTTQFKRPKVLVTQMSATKANTFALVLYPKISLLDGRYANNPWLQELPDPISKTTWDNYVCMAPERALKMGIQTGDIVRLKAGAAEPLELPALVQPGQHPETIAIALGYGRKGTDRFAGIGPQWIEGRPTTGSNGLVGKNAAPWLQLADGRLRYDRENVEVERTGQHVRLARTQKYQSLDVPSNVRLPGGERRPNVEQTTLAAFQNDPKAGHHLHFQGETLWPDDHRYTGHHWGLIIDLNKCTGCSACAISCQAENNVPVVGRDEVRRSREMHWLRIDRYYTGEGTDVDVLYQPMMCHQCDNAPCETVCPVIATAHSDEGLNQQVYNRCVGTRYCANNCPYKVRRFNWFNYAHPDKVQNLSMNPDVTVRTRGVMEKCSFCVQRIQNAKLEAKRQGVKLADGDIQTACQQSCPSKAIVFGDLNDPKSAIAKATESPRCFQVLAELNVRPTVGYLRVIRNREGGEEHNHHV